MKTQEERRTEAEAIARANPEWRWDGVHLTHRGPPGAVVYLGGYGTRWRAWKDGVGTLCGPRGRASAFYSPTAAIRALGFSLAPESTDD